MLSETAGRGFYTTAAIHIHTLWQYIVEKLPQRYKMLADNLQKRLAAAFQLLEEHFEIKLREETRLFGLRIG